MNMLSVGASGRRYSLIHQVPVESVVDWSDNIVIDSALSDVFGVVLGNAATTINAPLNPIPGKKIIIRITQYSGGGITVSWNAVFRFSVDIPVPVISATAGKVDYLGFIYNGTSSTWDCVGVVQGF